MEECANQDPAELATPPRASMAQATTPRQTMAHMYVPAGALPPFSELADPAKLPRDDDHGSDGYATTFKLQKRKMGQYNGHCCCTLEVSNCTNYSNSCRTEE